MNERESMNETHMAIHSAALPHVLYMRAAHYYSEANENKEPSLGNG